MAEGKLESWETYVARRNALSPIKQAPQSAYRHSCIATRPGFGSDESAPANVREHLEVPCLLLAVVRTAWHTRTRGSATSPVNDYLLSLYWQWHCSACQGTMPFDPGVRTATAGVLHWHHWLSDEAETLCAEHRAPHRAKLFVFFDWLKINRMVIANPVQRKIPAPDPTIRHYPPEVIKQLCSYMTTRCRPCRSIHVVSHHFPRTFRLGVAACSASDYPAVASGYRSPTLAEAYYVNHPKACALARRSLTRPT